MYTVKGLAQAEVPTHELALILASVATAAALDKTLILSYRDGAGVATGREVIPTEVFVTDEGNTIIRADDVAKGESRSFRADRILGFPFVGNNVLLASQPTDEELVLEQVKSFTEEAGYSYEGLNPQVNYDGYGDPSAVVFSDPRTGLHRTAAIWNWYDRVNQEVVGLRLVIYSQLRARDD